MSQLHCRLARPSDYQSLVRLCRRAVSPSDYVLRYLKSAIQGHGLFLALHGNELVGMTNFEDCIDGSGWLGMARTDPHWRRRGVAVFLQQAIAQHARKKGVHRLRLWTRSDNKPALTAIVRGGFRPICRAVHMSQLLPSKKTRTRQSPAETVSKQLADDILGSRYISKMNGFMSYGWGFIKADSGILRQIARKRELYQIDNVVLLLTSPEPTPWSRNRRVLHSEFTLLQGPVEESLRTAKRTAGSIGLGLIGAYVPYDHRIITTAKKQGFHVDSWADHCEVFEKKLR